MSSIIHHLIDFPSLEQGWKIQTSIISNYDHAYRVFFCPAFIHRHPFRDGKKKKKYNNMGIRKMGNGGRGGNEKWGRGKIRI